MVCEYGQVSINDDTSHHVYILMHTISILSEPTMKVNIHNQCSDFKLIDQKYVTTDAIADRHQQVEAGSMASIGFLLIR
jgi:hypothetical protein